MAVVSFVSSIFVVKNLGPEQFGILQEVTAYFLILQNFENIVNPNIIKRRMIERPDTAHDLIATVGAMISLIGVLFFATSCAIYFFTGMPQKVLILVIMCSAMVFRYSNGMIFYFDSRLETLKGQISLNVGNGLSSIYKVVASFARPTSVAQAFALPIQYFFTMLIHLYQYRKIRPVGFRAKYDLRVFYGLVLSSLPLFISTFVDIFKNRLPFIYLGSVISALDLGLFSAGVKLTEPWLFVASALSISFWPKLIRSKSESRAQHLEVQSLFIGTVFYFFLFLSVFGFLFGDFFVENILGPKYNDSEIIFRLQSLALLPQALSIALGILEINLDLAKYSLMRNGASLVMMVILLLYLTPQYGAMAGSIAILVSSSFSALVMPFLMSKTRTIAFVAVLAPLRSPAYLFNRIK